MADFEKNESQSTAELVYKRFKSISIIGYIFGSFPCIGVFRDKIPEFKIRSVIYLYSWILFFGKIYMTQLAWQLVQAGAQLYENYENERLKKFSQLETYSLFFAISLTFSTGLFSNFINLVWTSKFLQVLQSIYIYDQKYLSNEDLKVSKVFNGIFWAVSTSILIIWYPTYMSIHAIYLSENNKLSPILTFLQVLISFTSVEFVVFSDFFKIFQLSRILIERFDNLTTILNDKIQFQNSKTSFSPKNQIKNKSKFRNWKHLSRQYISFRIAFSKYLKFASIYYVFYFTQLSISVICVLFIVVRSQGSNILQYVITSLLGRIVNLSMSGQAFETNWKRLLRLTLRASLLSIKNPKESQECKEFIELVLTSPISVNAFGLFKVNKKTILSVIKMVISHIIILIQFDDAEGSGKGSL